MAYIETINGNPLAVDSFVTPEQFGAVGDGVADDTAAVQSAISSGSMILFNGTYRCTTISINGVDGLSLIGASGAKLTGNVALQFENCTNIEVDSLSFDSCTHAGFTVKFTDCVSVKMVCCKFSNLTNSAVQIHRSSVNADCKRFIFDGCEFANVNTSETWGGGIYWDALGPSSSDSLAAKQISDVTVANCQFENVGCAGVNSGGCIGLSVIGNICDQNNASFTATMGLLTASRESAKVAASGNIVLHTKFEGMIFNKSSDVTVAGNYFLDCKYGITAEASSSNCHFSNNTIDGGTYGINTNTVSGITIDGNRIVNTLNGVYIGYGTSDMSIVGNTMNTSNMCVTGQTSDSDHQTIGIQVIGNILKSNTGAITAIMHSGRYAIADNIVEIGDGAVCAFSLKRPVDQTNYLFNVVGNIVNTEAPVALQINDTPANQTDGTVRFRVHDNDFSKCSAVYNKDNPSRILAFSYARNKHPLTAVELFGYFDGESEMSYSGTLAALKAETPGGQNMSYVRWQIGCVVECTDTFIHVTRAGNPSAGATLQYKEW